jgi:hypothetical protein
VNAQNFGFRRVLAAAIVLCAALVGGGAAHGYSDGVSPGSAFKGPGVSGTQNASPDYCMIEQRRRGAGARIHSRVAALPQCGSSGGNVTPYWGFNYLNGANPPYSACPWPQFVETPIACSGWNYWDRSQIDKRNGGSIRLGFCNDGGDHIHCYSTGAAGGTGIIWISRTAVNNYYQACCGSSPIPAYNKVFCDYDGGNASYGQCQAVVL